MEREWEVREVRVAVAGENAGGEPDFFFVKVRCRRGQYEVGEHYEAARARGVEQGYFPRLAFDEFDPAGRALLPLFTWEQAEVVDISGG